MQVRHQLHITVELDPCIALDASLPKGHSIARPSLYSERGVGVFWGDELLHLRRFFAPHGTIDDLIKIIDRIAREGTSLPEGLEFFAVEEKYPLRPYEKDGKDYTVNAHINLDSARQKFMSDLAWVLSRLEDTRRALPAEMLARIAKFWPHDPAGSAYDFGQYVFSLIQEPGEPFADTFLGYEWNADLAHPEVTVIMEKAAEPAELVASST